MISMHLLHSDTEYDETCKYHDLEAKLGYSTDEIDSKIRTLCELFETKLEVNIFVAEKNSVWKTLVSKFEIPDWVCAFTFDNNVFVKSKDLWNNANIGTFEETVVHEIVHCFLSSCYGEKLPIWLNEALAIYFSGQSKYYDQLSTADINLDELNYNDLNLYDLSISKLNELLKHMDCKSIIEIYLAGGVTSEAKYS